MAEAKTVAKIKKRWFTILAPELFGKREIADAPAIAAENLVGRYAEANGQMLTGTPRDSSRKYKLKIVEAIGDKVRTEAEGYYMAESFVQRTARRFKERFILVMTCATKDDKKATVKFYFLSLKKLHHSERGAILAKTREFVASEIKTSEAAKLFDPNTIENLAANLKKATADIYSIDKIMVTRLSI
jgi:small subunit ribosomal protein S3Ae